MIKITLKDGSVKEVEKGISVIELAKQISEGLARVATVAEVNGEIKDLRYSLEEDASVNILTLGRAANRPFPARRAFIICAR